MDVATCGFMQGAASGRSPGNLLAQFLAESATAYKSATAPSYILSRSST